MITLQLSQSAAEGRHRVSLRLTEPGRAPVVASTEFEFAVPADDGERVRWYLEDFLEYPQDPAPKLAARVEQRITELGTSLFTAVFDSDRDAQDVWAAVRGRLGEVRVEISGSVEAAALPWEWLRDPRSGQPVALQVESFVRVNHSPGSPTRLPDPSSDDRLRVLLVICRPLGGDDVPFRSVARQLTSLGGRAREILQLDVLRPPTFARLATVLEAAARAGRPYHVVHFDGHGAYLDTERLTGGSGAGSSPLRYGLLSPARPGRHGYLLFEDPDLPGNEQLVDGPALGALLARAGVPVLLLNACRSAYAEAPAQPRTADAGGAGESGVHTQVRAYGSLALEASDAGLAGVVAMRYNVYVVTAAQFVTDLYTALLAGQPLGAAVSAGRRRLAAQPNRTIAFQPRPVQDWSVPVVWEAVPLKLFETTPEPAKLTIVAPASGLPAGDEADRGADGLPRPPQVGFFGRDETLLALDREFDRQRVVVLHAYAGAGKTSTAVEFARWYTATGGLSANPDARADGDRGGVVLFSSLTQYTPLSRLLNKVADAFAPALKAGNILWSALDDGQRRKVVMQLLGLVPVLWIWDNVEPVAGFPHSADSPWSPAEQRELAGFLHDLSATRARVLLTSRRDEAGWLDGLPGRVTLPAMPMRERIQLAQALSERRGHRIGDVDDWRPLLRYSAGNPLTITVLVGQALRTGITRKAQIEAFVARLRAGEADLDDEESQGRSRSLGASLGYGLATAFTDLERVRLSVLQLFQGSVDVVALVIMGASINPHRLPELAGLDRDTAIGLLDRAADLGLLTALGGGHYGIHPALPWYFRHLHHATGLDSTASAQEAAYTIAIAGLGGIYLRQYSTEGRHQVIDALQREEANLLHARALARQTQRWDAVIGCMQGLRTLYEHVGRGAEWARLVDEIVPDLVDPTTGGPRPGHEDAWAVLTDYRIRITRDTRDWAGAEALQRSTLVRSRALASDALAADPDRLTDIQRNRIRSLAVDEEGLGHTLREKESADCITHYQQAAELFRRIRARREEGVIAFNLGHAYLTIPGLRDLDQAERWYRRDLELMDEDDLIGRAQTTTQLGVVAYERFRDARHAGEPQHILVDRLNTAIAAYHQALDGLPEDDVSNRAAAHHQLGNSYSAAGRIDTALTHYQKSIRYKEAANRYSAGETRYAVALMLKQAGRPADALLYAHAALRNYEPYGANATSAIEKTRRLIADLEA